MSQPKTEVYLDNAATMTKFPAAIQAEADFYREINANPLRGLYRASVLATTGVEECRQAVLDFVHADDSYTVIFTRGTTEALNLVAEGLLTPDFQPEVAPVASNSLGLFPASAPVVVDIESHHSNLLPWHQRYQNVRVISDFSSNALLDSLSSAKIISLTAVSNVTGEDFTARIRKVRTACGEAILGVDAAQALCSGTFDLAVLGADFMAFSGHKLGAPMGIGGLVIKKSLAEKLRPLCYGGEMVDAVPLFGSSAYGSDTAHSLGSSVHSANPAINTPVLSPVPQRLEAGTLPVGAIFGLKAALRELQKLDLLAKSRQITQLVADTAIKMRQIPGAKILAANGHILTFQIEGVHPHDVAQVLAHYGVSVRAGWLCAQPFLEYKGWGPVVRASFSIFNTPDDAVALVQAVSKVRSEMRLE